MKASALAALGAGGGGFARLAAAGGDGEHRRQKGVMEGFHRFSPVHLISPISFLMGFMKVSMIRPAPAVVMNTNTKRPDMPATSVSCAR